jgi:hypothetical protein
LRLLADRKERFDSLNSAMDVVATKHGLRIVRSPRNEISLAITLTPLICDACRGLRSAADAVVPPIPCTACVNNLSGIGGALFLRGITGSRVVALDGAKSIPGADPSAPEIFDDAFGNTPIQPAASLSRFCSHFEQYPDPYITCAAAVGMGAAEVDAFAAAVDAELTRFPRHSHP